MILKSERLILRPWEEQDAPELYKYAKDPRVGPVAGWPVHESVENSREIIKAVLSAPETYAVVLKETMLPVGSAGIILEDRVGMKLTEREAEIGYWIGVPYWGQGLIPEAVKALLCRCFTDLDRTGVWCGYYDDNIKSKRVQEKSGFIYHHTVENYECELMNEFRTCHFSYITKEQWIKAV